MERYYFKIADVSLTVEADRSHIYENMWDFAVPCTEEANRADVFCSAENVLISVIPSMNDYDEPNYSEQKLLVGSNGLTVYEDKYAYISVYPTNTAVSHCVHEKNSLKSSVYLRSIAPEKSDNYIMYAVRDAFLFHAQKLGRIAVHSASIIYNNAAWLFSAPSGTGKTTHIDLWRQQNIDFENLNGDLCFLCERDGRAVAAGSPWCGTSGVFSNRQEYLGGVVFLKQGNENLVHECDRTDASMQLLARCLTPNWNAELTKKNAAVVNRIVSDGSYAVLKCTPNGEAAEASKKYIDSKKGEL